MRDTWYADQRDLVKWSALVHLAVREGLDAIIQVPFLRHGTRPSILFGDQQVSLPGEVWEFFRDVRAVTRLGERLGKDIVLVEDVFLPRDRERYRQQMLAAIDRVTGRRVVLLDPDTGIQPAQARAEHAMDEDIRGVWRALRAREWLVAYQHAPRRRNWHDEARRRFAVLCDGCRVQVIHSQTIAPDVIFLAAEKPSMT